MSFGNQQIDIELFFSISKMHKNVTFEIWAFVADCIMLLLLLLSCHIPNVSPLNSTHFQRENNLGGGGGDFIQVFKSFKICDRFLDTKVSVFANNFCAWQFS